MTSLSRPRVEFISTILQTVLNLGLLCLGLILVVFLGKETVHLADVLFAPEQTSKYELVEGLVVYFLYFEFIALIVKYFQSGFHFPLRYFVYIGITAIVRLIIVDHKSPLPPSGPRSTIQSAVLITSRLCSITTMVLP